MSALRGHEMEGIQPKAVDAHIQPKAHYTVHFLAQLRVVPVQVGLLDREVVQLVDIGGRVVLPGTVVAGNGTVAGPARRATSNSSRGTGWCASCGSAQTTGACRCCGSPLGLAPASGPAGAGPPAARQSRPYCRIQAEYGRSR